MTPFGNLPYRFSQELNVIHGEKVVPLNLRFASYIDNDCRSNGFSEGDLFRRPSAFGKMKGSVEVGPDML